MRKVFFVMAILGCLVSFTSCNDYETYGEKKDSYQELHCRTGHQCDL